MIGKIKVDVKSSCDGERRAIGRDFDIEFWQKLGPTRMGTAFVEIPDEFAGQLIAAGKDPARAALEAIALEGYRSDRLSTAEVRGLLGFETRMEVDAFLKEHGVFLIRSQRVMLATPNSTKCLNEAVKRGLASEPAATERPLPPR